MTVTDQIDMNTLSRHEAERIINDLLRQGRELEKRALSAEAALSPFAALTPSSLYPADGSENEGYTLLLADGHYNPRRTTPDFTGQDMAAARAHFDKYASVVKQAEPA